MSDTPHSDLQNSSALGRLLEELSWCGSTIRDYRNGGRGFENVLTAEALQALDFLPRRAFLGDVIDRATGADEARRLLVDEIESAQVTLLPGNHYLIPSGDRHETKLGVQPDGLIESPSAFCLVEAKRIRRSSFQQEQLARELVLTLRNAGNRTPLMLLILGEAPPVLVAKHGRLSIRDAIAPHLQSVLDRAENHSFSAEFALAKIEEVVCWTTWHELANAVESQRQSYTTGDSSADAAIDRLAHAVSTAVQWHS